MDNSRDKFDKYILSIDKTISDSVLNLEKDIKFDNYNEDGCNGYVFFGTHKIFKQRVAVKYYFYNQDSHEEVALIKNLNHKNILHVWDAHIVKDGWAYFITDELINGTLENKIMYNFISTNEALNIIKCLLSGLGKMHQHPNYLLHRDLKPANIFIDNQNNPVIADFGSVKRMPKSNTKVKASKNTALYRPPEAYDNGFYVFSSDIYQIGIIMFQVLGGNLSYKPQFYMNKRQLKEYSLLTDDFTISKYEDYILNGKASKGCLLNIKTLPFYTKRQLISIIKKATNPNYLKRYQNTAEFFLDLHKIGEIPNWKKNADYCYCEYKSNLYRFLNSNKGYIIEKSKNGEHWRKVPNINHCSSMNELYNLSTKIIGL